MGGARRGIETLTLTHDHIAIYPVYNSRFPCVPAKGCVPAFPLGREAGGEGPVFRVGMVGCGISLSAPTWLPGPGPLRKEMLSRKAFLKLVYKY